MAYYSMSNAFFRDLTVSSVFHSYLLTAKGIDLVVAYDGFLCLRKLSVFSVVATLITEVLFKQFLVRIAV